MSINVSSSAKAGYMGSSSRHKLREMDFHHYLKNTIGHPLIKPIVVHINNQG
jgi:hypothetical protein